MNQWHGSLYIPRGYNFQIKINFSPWRLLLSKQTVQTLMKCRTMQHYIWNLAVCQSTCLGVSGLQRVKQDQYHYRLTTAVYKSGHVFIGGSNWSSTTRIRQNVCHMFGISALTKSCLGKNLSYKILTPERRYVVGTQKDCFNETILLSTQNIYLNW